MTAHVFPHATFRECLGSQAPILRHQDTSATHAVGYPLLTECGLGGESVVGGANPYFGFSFVYDPWVLYAHGLITTPTSDGVPVLPLVVNRLLSIDPRDDPDGRLTKDGGLAGDRLRRLAAGDLTGLC
jgi:hypothetical protein